MFAITDLETVTEYGRSGACMLCDEDLEHGQVRARLEYPDRAGWAHEDCATLAETAGASSTPHHTNPQSNHAA